MLSRFLEQAQSDRPVYTTDVRKAFQIYGSRPFHIHVTLYGGTVQDRDPGGDGARRSGDGAGRGHAARL